MGIIEGYRGGEKEGMEEGGEKEGGSGLNDTLNSLDESFMEGMEGILGIEKTSSDKEMGDGMVPMVMPPRHLSRRVEGDEELEEAFVEVFLMGKGGGGRNTGDMGAGEVEEVGRIVGMIARR